MAKTNGGKGNFSRHFTRRDFLSTSLKAGSSSVYDGFVTPILMRKVQNVITCFSLL